jgi:rhodanese-related sulfurtransferase
MPTRIDADEVRRLLHEEDATLIDVLSQEEYAEQHIPGGRNVPLKELTADAVSDLDRDRPVIIYCHDDT